MPTLGLAQFWGLFEASLYIASSGMGIVEIDPDAESLSISMPPKPQFERFEGSGQFHGGPIASLIDTVGCFALVMLLGRGVPTVNFRTDYLRLAIKTGSEPRYAFVASAERLAWWMSTSGMMPENWLRSAVGRLVARRLDPESRSRSCSLLQRDES